MWNYYPPLPQCQHSPVVFDYVFQTNPQYDHLDQGLATHWHWQKGQHDVIRGHLSQIDWNYELQDLDVDSIFTKFISTQQSLIDLYVLYKSHNSKPWYCKLPYQIKE